MAGFSHADNDNPRLAVEKQTARRREVFSHSGEEGCDGGGLGLKDSASKATKISVFHGLGVFP